MSTSGTPAASAAPPDPAPDAFARALRGFGPVGITAILATIVLPSILGPLRAVGPLLWAWRSRTPLHALGLARPASWAATITLGIAGGAALKLLMKAVVMPLLGAPAMNARYGFLEGDPAMLAWMLLVVILGAGLGEELTFRGFLFERLGQLLGDTTGARIAIVAGTSLLFGLVHVPEQGIHGAGQATLTGLLMGTIYARTRNLWLPVVLHAAFNVTAVFIIYWGLESRIAHFLFR
jgi:uncharacterized protein